MTATKCKMCGATSQSPSWIKIVKCEYCVTTQNGPSADNEKKMTLFNRANLLCLNNEFDKAAGIHEMINQILSESIRTLKMF